VHLGRPAAHTVRLSVIDYDGAGHFREWEPADPAEVVPLVTSPTISWINVDGIHDVELIAQLGRLFGMHPLIVEDILHAGQRPKVEDLGNQLYVVMKMLTPGAREGDVEWEQLSLVVGENYVLSFQEKPGGDFFDPVRERIRQDKGRIRKAGADYLAHALIDLVVDKYFLVLEPLGDRIETLEDAVVARPAPRHIQRINELKRAVTEVRRSVWPLREVLGALERTECALVRDTTRPYFKDVYDHTIQIVDTAEILRDMLAGMMEIYMSSLSNRLNEVIKVLTIIATLFIPLTFLVGVYGMNFDHMPELRWRYGYAATWAVMIAATGAMLYFFRRRGWLD
jgi:magnesium transporter